MFSRSRKAARTVIWFSFNLRASRERLAARLFFFLLCQYLSSWKREEEQQSLSEWVKDNTTPDHTMPGYYTILLEQPCVSDDQHISPNKVAKCVIWPTARLICVCKQNRCSQAELRGRKTSIWRFWDCWVTVSLQNCFTVTWPDFHPETQMQVSLALTSVVHEGTGWWNYKSIKLFIPFLWGHIILLDQIYNIFFSTLWGLCCKQPLF